MRIDGRCHCGQIAFVLDWPGAASDIVARECGCTFCRKHGAVWTSHAGAKLSVTFRQVDAVSTYVFGSETATFHVCGRCGVVPIVTSDIDDRLYAVVNVNTFEHMDLAGLRRQPASFDGEDPPSRLARRQRHWIPDVRLIRGTA